jgi:hypothetical protein
VIVTFSEEASGTTHVIFRNIGYGAGEEWQKAREYFHRAWGEVVLPRFRYYMERGAFSWTDMPDFSSYSLV